MYKQITTISVLLAAWVLVSCSFGGDDATSQPAGADQRPEEQSPIVKALGLSPLATYDGETSMEERVIEYPVVVRATLDRVTSDVIVLSGYADGQYAVVLKLHLEVEEYLNGSGADKITGVWPSFVHYDSMAEAEADRASLVAKRTTPYDDMEAIFFLTDDFWIYGAARADDTYYMNGTYGFAGTSWFDTIDVRSLTNRLWLPTNNVGTGDNREYILALPGSNLAGSDDLTVSSTSTITLAALKTRIAAVTTELNKSGGTAAERKQCLRNKYTADRYNDYYRAQYGREPSYKARITEHTVEPDAPAGTIIFEDWTIALSPDDKPKTAWLQGDDSSLFHIADGDSLPGDNNSVVSGPKGSIYYPQQLTNVRPLPSGSYSITLKEQLRSPVAQLCFDVDSFDWTVTVTSADGTLHEFFFDPVTVGSAVLADASNGVLNPASFTGADGATSTISRLAWEPSSTSSAVTDGQVKLLLTSDPDETIGEHILDFIELDGSVSLSLDVFDAAVEPEPASDQDTQTHTLSWMVSSQPWEGGDELMVRIRP